MELVLSNKINSLSDQLKKLEVTHSTNIPMEISSDLQTASHVPTPDSSVAVLSIADELSDREQWRLVLYKIPEVTNTQSRSEVLQGFL